MKNQQPTTVTLDEAVARLINLDYIPEGYTFDQITDGFLGYTQGLLEETEELTEKEIVQLERIAAICELRHELALKLKESIDYEIKRANTEVKSKVSPYTPHREIDTIELDYWCKMTFGIALTSADLSQNIEQEIQDRKLKDKFSRVAENSRNPEDRTTRLDNLSRTFYVLAIMYAEKSNGKYFSAKKLNVSQMAVSISKQADNVLGSGKGQSVEAIKKRIEDAASIIPNWVRQE